MSSALSTGNSSFLGVGLAMGVGVGAVVSTMRQKAPEPMDIGDKFEPLRAERDVLVAKLEEAQLRIEALEEKVDASQKELAHQKLEQESKVSSVTSADAERDVLAARLKEAQLQIEAFEKKHEDLGRELSQVARKSSKAGEELEETRGLVGTREAEVDMLQKELARSKLECESKVSSMRQTLSSVSAELEGAKAEQAEMRKELQRGKEAEVNAATLQAELDALRKEFKECAAAAAQCEAAKHQARALELERAAMLQEVESGKKAKKELEDVRRRFEDLVADRDAVAEQHGDAVRQVRILTDEQESLKTNVSTKKKKRKDSFKALSQGLSDISARLDSAQASWTPKQHIGNTQKKVDSLWQDLAADESEDDFLRGA